MRESGHKIDESEPFTVQLGSGRGTWYGLSLSSSTHRLQSIPAVGVNHVTGIHLGKILGRVGLEPMTIGLKIRA